MEHIRSYKDLRVYKAAIDAAMRVWLDLALRCKYISEAEADELDQTYDRILAQLVRMIDRPDQWIIRKRIGQKRQTVED